MKRRFLVLCGGVMLAFSAGAGAALMFPTKLESTVPIGMHLAKTRGTMTAPESGIAPNSGGSSLPLEVATVVDGIDLSRARGKRHIELHWEIDNLSNQSYRVLYAWALVDDAGTTLFRGKAPKSARLERQGVNLNERWAFPTMEDGFYMLRLTVEGRSEAPSTASALHDWFFEVRSGEVFEITEEEWNLRSDSSLGQEVAS